MILNPATSKLPEYMSKAAIECKSKNNFSKFYGNFLTLPKVSNHPELSIATELLVYIEVAITGHDK